MDLLQLPALPATCHAFAAAGRVGAWHNLHAATAARATDLGRRVPRMRRTSPWRCERAAWQGRVGLRRREWPRAQ